MIKRPATTKSKTTVSLIVCIELDSGCSGCGQWGGGKVVAMRKSKKIVNTTKMWRKLLVHMRLCTS